MLNLGLTSLDDIIHNSRVIIYPSGRIDVISSPFQCFREAGWEAAFSAENEVSECGAGKAADTAANAAASLQRAKRRARSAVKTTALSNTDLDMFVTFTLDQSKIDRYDIGAITKKLNMWLDNAVRRRGLKYILVPELHRDGAVHFHGLINGAALCPVDSGTLTQGGKPRKPRSAKLRAEMLADGWHVVYNLLSWPYGFSTGIMLYGERDKAVNYVTKYIAKTTAKVGGRWYYHGGELAQPSVILTDLDFEELSSQYPDNVWKTPDGARFLSATISEGSDIYERIRNQAV